MEMKRKTPRNSFPCATTLHCNKLTSCLGSERKKADRKILHQSFSFNYRFARRRWKHFHNFEWNRVGAKVYHGQYRWQGRNTKSLWAWDRLTHSYDVTGSDRRLWWISCDIFSGWQSVVHSSWILSKLTARHGLASLALLHSRRKQDWFGTISSDIKSRWVFMLFADEVVNKILEVETSQLQKSTSSLWEWQNFPVSDTPNELLEFIKCLIIIMPFNL